MLAQILLRIGRLERRLGQGPWRIDEHLLYSAVSCAGLIDLIGRPPEPRRSDSGLALIATAILWHAIRDRILHVVPAVPRFVIMQTFGRIYRRKVARLWENGPAAAVPPIKVTAPRGEARTIREFDSRHLAP